MVKSRLWSFRFKGFSMSELRELVMDREAWCAAIHRVAKSRTRLSNWIELNWMIKLVIVRQGRVLYELCLSLPLERMIGMELSGFVALIYGLHIYRDGYEDVAWDSHEFKVIHINKLEATPTKPTIGMIPMGQNICVLLVWPFSSCFLCVCVCLQWDWRM